MNKSTTVGAVMCGALLTALTASAREPVSPEEIVKSFQEAFDVRPQQLLKNRNCICARGVFMGTSAASSLSRSAMFREVSVPVVARFSASRSNPDSWNSREMDLEFRLANGSVQHMAMLNTPLFTTSDAVTFGAMIAAAKPDPNTGRPDLQRLHQFLAAHPDAFAQANFVTGTDAPSSYASSAYFSVHTFRFIDGKGRTRFVRWRFVPQDGETTVSASEASGSAQAAAQERFVKRLASGPVRWDMIVYLGEPSDTTDNPSIAWPEERMHIKAGTLTISRAMRESAVDCAQMNFDPLVATDGIAPADDPVLLFRSPTYALAFSEILGQALAPVPPAAITANSQ